MAEYKFSDSVIALAGICQAINCVQSIAKTGQANQQDMQTLFQSTLKLDAESTEDIYQKHQFLTSGFSTLIEQLSGGKTDPDFGRYLINILNLHKQFTNNQAMQQLMVSRIQQANRLNDYQSDQEISADTVSQLAEIYKDTISTLTTKIQVTGNSKYLEQTTNQDKIRALLLSGIRAAVLWNQVGGRKRHFLLQKTKILQVAKAFLA